MIAGFAAQQQITTRAFDRLEADQIAQDAQRVRIGLEAHVRLLANYGATNSIWDNSYADVHAGDRAAFLSDFPPDQVRGIFGLDGVLGVAPDGTLRVGGLVDGTRFAAPPPGLTTAAELGRLFDRGAAAGASRCGQPQTATAPFLYCGFAAHKSDGGSVVAGGLIYLSSLDSAGLASIGSQASELSEVACRQRAQMEALDHVMRGVMARIEAMSSVTDSPRAACGVSWTPGSSRRPRSPWRCDSPWRTPRRCTEPRSPAPVPRPTTGSWRWSSGRSPRPA